MNHSLSDQNGAAARRLRADPDGPRERLRSHGASALSDAELLSLLVRGSCRGGMALDGAREVLRRSGGLAGLAVQSFSEVCLYRDLGPARAASVLAAFELGTRLSLQRWTPGVSVQAPEDVHAYFYPRLRWSMREQFFVLLLDGRHRLKGEVRISLGTLNACLVHPREVFRQAIRESAAALILVHNHPSGDPAPSREDREVTKRLVEAGRVIGIRVIDHVVVAESGYYSFQSQGEIDVSEKTSPRGAKVGFSNGR